MMKLICLIPLFFFKNLSAQTYYDTTDKRFSDFKQIEELIKKNPASVDALNSLNFYFTSLKYEDGLKYFNRLDSSLYKNKNYTELSEKISLAACSKPGTVIDNFSLKDTKRKLLSVDSIIRSHNLVLLDFWGSWCESCREKAGFLKSLYKNHSIQGFTIVSISVKESDPIKWIKAIQNDGIGLWTQCLSTEEDMQSRFGVKDVPVYILIDNNMKVLGRYNGRLPSLIRLELFINEYLFTSTQ